MSGLTCPRCGRTVDKLIPIDDADSTAWQTETTGVSWVDRDYLCVSCTREILGITDRDLIREERLLANNTEFHLNLVKGRLAQVLIETIFQEFGYEVYPYGYESYLTNIIKSMRKGTANLPVRKIRASPDLFVYDRELNDGYLVEVKATTTRDEAHSWISKWTLDTYHQYWSEAMLVVYCIPSGNIYCRQICNIKLDDLPVEQPSTNQWKNYVLNLAEDFQDMPSCFRLIDPNRYKDFTSLLRQILSQFSI
jgi:hypothetical protein